MVKQGRRVGGLSISSMLVQGSVWPRLVVVGTCARRQGFEELQNCQDLSVGPSRGGPRMFFLLLVRN